MDDYISTTIIPEAPLEDRGFGLEPTGEGWYIVNVADAAGWQSDSFGSAMCFESKENRFGQYGVNIQVLAPGQPNCRYHEEPDQESFLVLAGECRVIVEEQERPLRAGDFFHCPPMTSHVTVGAGNGPCAILMIGGRTFAWSGGYPESAAAARYGASVSPGTADPDVAYANDAKNERARVDLSWIFG